MSNLNKEAEKNSNHSEKKKFNYKILFGVLVLIVLVVGVIYFYKSLPENLESGEANVEEKIVVRNLDDCYKYFEDDKLEKCLEVRYVDLAITNKDLSYCEKISDSAIKEKCIEVVGK